LCHFCFCSTFEWWEVEIDFRVTGRGRFGADGMTFWFTTERSHDGSVFGSSGVDITIIFFVTDNENGQSLKKN
jgi:hypothetical protein